MAYGPAGAAAVPIPSLLLLPLGVALAFFGYRALRKQAGRQILGALLLALSTGLSAISSLHVQGAIAAVIVELKGPGRTRRPRYGRGDMSNSHLL